MPRQARLDVSGALHHIMVRGIDKSNIFRYTQNKARFLERLGQNVQDAKCSVYSLVLMDSDEAWKRSDYRRRRSRVISAWPCQVSR